ncbi:unnamed protein product [Calypogeia fissa]
MNRNDNNVEANRTREKKVVLFGRTGDGKSTIANALVTGGVGPERFTTSSSARGCTTRIQKETGRGWTVTDTVGLGESESVAVPNADAKKMLTDFLKEVKDEYSHIIYVKKATNKITTMDEMIWLIFTSIFHGAENAFVIVFTGVNEEWLRKNRPKLPAYMRNQTILVADIPPVHRRAVLERRMRAIRESSIRNLEENLVRLFDERGNVCSSPDIARMNDLELEQKSRSLIQFIVDTIKRLYKEVSWKSVATKLGPLVNVVDIILNIVNMS